MVCVEGLILGQGLIYAASWEIKQVENVYMSCFSKNKYTKKM